jgi:hypothetical protein
MNILRNVSLAVVVLLLQACSGGEKSAPTTAPASAPANAAPAQAAQNPAAAGDIAPESASNFSSARVFIASPADGATLTSPVTVVFGVEDFTIAPAGTFEPGTGHHHLLIDTALPPLDQPIPTDTNHMHFGKAQTEAVIELAPGQHTLQLVLGDGYHVPHDPALISTPVTITVTEAGEAVE